MKNKYLLEGCATNLYRGPLQEGHEQRSAKRLEIETNLGSS